MSFAKDCAIAAEALEAFAARAGTREGPVITQPPMRQLADNLDLDRLIRDGGLTGDALAQFLDTYLASATRLVHPRYMAHQVAVPQPTSAIAALVDGFTNNAMAIYEMGPPAATIEHVVLDWMLAKAGWRPAPFPGESRPPEPHGGGVLTHGGSLANLTVLLAARGRVAPKAWAEGTPRNLVILAPATSHYSIARAAGILGLGQNALRHPPCDGDGRLVPAQLGPFIDNLRRDGSQILAVVANACSTALGLYDRLRDIAEVCRDRAVWLHVDGAHGASALVSERLRRHLDGLELADSLIWDAHKMLRTSVLAAAVLVRDASDLDGAFREEASYLFHDKDQPGFDFLHRTVECTKAALGLKIFAALAAEGERGMAAFVERQTDLARTAAAWLRAQPGISVAVEPETSIVCFRLDGDDALQLEIRKRLTARGEHYISTTEAKGRRWLRLAFMNPATEMRDVETLVDEIREHAKAIAGA